MARSNADPSLARPARRRWLAAWPAALLAPRWLHAAEAPYALRPWPERRPVPALDLPDLDGRRWNLADLQGRPVLLNFWATWCEPCRDEMPSLDALARRHAADGLAVLAVDYQEGEAKVREFLARLGVTLTVLLDRDGLAARQWTPRVFPTTVLIDRRGRPRSTVVGEIDWGGPDASALVAPLLQRTA